MPEILSKGILDWDANFYKNAWNSYYKRGKSFSYLNMKRSLGKFLRFQRFNTFNVFKRLEFSSADVGVFTNRQRE